MTWRSTELAAVPAESRAVLAPVSVSASAGPLDGITLLPALIGVRRNPEDERSQEVVPAVLSLRWLPLKARVPITEPEIELKMEKARAAIREFRSTRFADVERAGYGPRNLALDREDVVQRTIEALRPPAATGASVDEVRGDARYFARLPDRAIEQISHAEA